MDADFLLKRTPLNRRPGLLDVGRFREGNYRSVFFTRKWTFGRTCPAISPGGTSPTPPALPCSGSPPERHRLASPKRRRKACRSLCKVPQPRFRTGLPGVSTSAFQIEGAVKEDGRG